MFGYGERRTWLHWFPRRCSSRSPAINSTKIHSTPLPGREETYQNCRLPLGDRGFYAPAAVPMIKLFLQKQRGPAARPNFWSRSTTSLACLLHCRTTIHLMGKPIADPIASIIVATIIAYNGVKLFIENFNFLLGQSPSRSTWQTSKDRAVG